MRHQELLTEEYIAKVLPSWLGIFGGALASRSAVPCSNEAAEKQQEILINPQRFKHPTHHVICSLLKKPIVSVCVVSWCGRRNLNSGS